MGIQADKIFVNLAVKDLNLTKEFFSKLGFEFNPQFTNEMAACMVINENIYAMLLVEDHFKTFTTKEIADTTKSAEAIVALSVDSKESVIETVNKALEAGGRPSKDPQDHGFMYGWGFEDINGHLWELFYMDQSALKYGDVEISKEVPYFKAARAGEQGRCFNVVPDEVRRLACNVDINKSYYMAEKSNVLRITTYNDRS